jgi:3-phosphoshikimate 1-carboxyvinyltransferase
MTALVVRGGAGIEGALRVPGDKAISHRALMLGSAAHGQTSIRGLAPGRDVASTRACLARYGVAFRDDDLVRIDGRGVEAWEQPAGPLDCENSATTLRILSGLAARCAFPSVLDGDESLRRRPVDRVVHPLRQLGATVSARDDRLPPLRVQGGRLVGADVRLPVASGQVKSAVLFAALGASGPTRVTEPFPSRDDSERMLRALGVEVSSHTDGEHRVEIGPGSLPGFDLEVPGDLSSAAFLVAAALLAGELRIEDVALNPSRAGFLDVVARMGGDVGFAVEESRLGEPCGHITAGRSRMRAIGIEAGIVPSLLDEVPLVAVLATQAEGVTTIRGATELRVKESDRISSMSQGLRALGAHVTETADGMTIEGPAGLRGADVRSEGDHRVAMSLAVAALVADGETRIDGWEAADVSWPGFEQVLRSLGADCRLED